RTRSRCGARRAPPRRAERMKQPDSSSPIEPALRHEGLAILEACCFVGATGGVASAVRMSARARKSAAIDDQVLLADTTTIEPALQNLAGAGRIASLRGQRRPRDVWRHSVVGHRSPGMILWSRLRKPDVSGISGQLAAFQRPRDRIAVADLAAGSVDDVRAALHLGD